MNEGRRSAASAHVLRKLRIAVVGATVLVLVTTVLALAARPAPTACGWLADAAGDAYLVEVGPYHSPGEQTSDKNLDLLAAEVSTRGLSAARPGDVDDALVRFDVSVADLALPTGLYGHRFRVRFAFDRVRLVVDVDIARGGSEATAVIGPEPGVGAQGPVSSAPARALADVAADNLVVEVPFSSLQRLGLRPRVGSLLADGNVASQRVFGLGTPTLSVTPQADAAFGGKPYSLGTRSCSDGRP